MICFNPFCSDKSDQTEVNCTRCGELLILRDWFVQESLPEGSLGALYLLRNEQNDLSVLKTPNALILENRYALNLENLFLKQEAMILQSLTNWQGAPRLEYFDQSQEWYYLIEEYIEGPTLKEVAGVRTLSEIELWLLLDSLLELLVHLAQKGIVHRDLKPDNLIITGNPARPLVIIDWGSASYLNQNWEPQLGHHDFTAPEVLEGNSRLDSDLYSIGKLIIYLLLFNCHEVSIKWSSHVPHLSPQLIEAINHLCFYRKIKDPLEFRKTFIPPSVSQQGYMILTRIVEDCW